MKVVSTEQCSNTYPEHWCRVWSNSCKAGSTVREGCKAYCGLCQPAGKEREPQKYSDRKGPI